MSSKGGGFILLLLGRGGGVVDMHVGAHVLTHPRRAWATRGLSMRA